MKRRVFLEPDAKQDINNARDWYDGIGSGASGQFMAALIEVLDRLARTPDGSVPVPSDDRARRILMKRFPFQVVFRLRGKNNVHVVAVRHTSRAPGTFS